ncbi:MULTISPECIES: type III pantothenate kinase [unclassified Lysobacter]
MVPTPHSPRRWLFDLGNSRLKCAPMEDDGSAGEVVAIDHRNDNLVAELERRLPSHIPVAYLASVASDELRVTLLQALSPRCGRISIARTSRGRHGLRVAYADPSRLGVDRFLAMLATHARGDGAALVCAVGTALTIDLMDAEGLHRGGRIAASPSLMREALHRRARQLPETGGNYIEFADDTLDALVSGCEGAALGLIERSLAMAREQLDVAPTLYLHGGGAPALLPRLPQARWVPRLVLDGLAHWARVEDPA